MISSFKTILIPIDLSINTEVAVKKGLELAEEGTTIHLLHVYGASSCFRFFLSRFITGANEHRFAETMKKVEQWKEAIEEYDSNITACSWIVVEDTVQKAIEKKAKQLSADLIIISKNSCHSSLPFLNTVSPHQIAQHTGVSVLTAKRGSIYNKIKTVVVPVNGLTTQHKLEMIAMLRDRFRIKIHLVTFMNDDNQPSHLSNFLLVFQRLNSSIPRQVTYAVLRGHNKAKALLQYAQKVNADVLLVHPVTETKIGWLNRHIADVLPPNSKVQVLAVQPASNSIVVK